MPLHRDIRSQTLHERLVRKSIKFLEKLWYSVEADYPEYRIPRRIDGIKPDLYAEAWWKKKTIVVEVETCDSLDNHAKAEWKAFSKYTKGRDSEFWVVVPDECLEEAKKKAKEWKIRVDKFLGL